MLHVQLQPYLFFEGDCFAALELYKSVFGGSAEVMQFKNAPPEARAPGCDPEGVMHASFKAPGIEFMASDGQPKTKYGGGSVTLAIATTDVAAGEKIFAALSDGATEVMPLQKMFWGATFGQLTDRHGIDWMFNLG